MEAMMTARPDEQTDGAPAAREVPSWTFEPGHTEAGFRARHMKVTWVHGPFKDVHGKPHLDMDQPLAVTFDGENHPTRLWTGQPDRNQHLPCPDCYNVVHHRTST